MEIGKRIRDQRIKNKMTHRQLSVRLGISVVSISGWENGTRQPSASALIALAKIFGVTTDYLLGCETENIAVINAEEKKLIGYYKDLDAFGKRAVNELCEIEWERVNALKVKRRCIPCFFTPSAAGYSAPLENEDFEMIGVDENVPREADFAVRIQGNSMAPYIKDGDTVFVKKENHLKIGDVGIFSVDGAMYCKQYLPDEKGNLTLYSVNRALKDADVFISCDSGITAVCLGKVLLDQKIPF